VGPRNGDLDYIIRVQGQSNIEDTAGSMEVARSNDVKTTQRGRVFLELRDVIRLNLLVRDRIDFDGFKRWYDTLYIPEQAALT